MIDHDVRGRQLVPDREAVRPLGDRPGPRVLARDHILGSSNLGHDFLIGLNGAGRDPTQRQRCAHELEEIAAGYRVFQFRSLLWKFALNQIDELISLSQFVQAAPVLLALRRFEVGAKPGNI